jgi:hypothetical protein
MQGVTNNPPRNPSEQNSFDNTIVHGSRSYFFMKIAETILLKTPATTLKLGYRTAKLITWVPLKYSFQKLAGYHTESANFFESEYLNAIKALRDLIFIPSVIKRAFQDMVATREVFSNDFENVEYNDYIDTRVDCTLKFQQFSSYLHGCKIFNVIKPDTEFAATSDASLQIIMASHLFKPGVMAINFGVPNVATFVTKKEGDSTQTVKVDAKSLWREEMTFHPTNGKMQSGNIPYSEKPPKGGFGSIWKSSKQIRENQKHHLC